MTLPTVAYSSREEAEHARDVLRQFGLTAGLTHTESFVDEAEVWWEVSIVELSAGWVHEALVVARGHGAPAPSEPRDTELDDYWRGTSRWDEQWERDEQRRLYGD